MNKQRTNIKVTPTLFVGLGTTGTEILKKLRELMYEEYGLGGLPIFRYIAIETDQGMEQKLDNANQMEGYERIHFVKASIANFERIKRKLDPRDIEYYNEHFDKWLNREVLTFARNFTVGAGHIRSAGRMCLWENWDDMQTMLSTAQGAIHAPASINKTNDILEKHYKAKGLEIDGNMVEGSTYAYIVGSLCGGTCSGMLIDMAYYCRGLIGVNIENQIYGMFTMFDQNAARENDRLVKTRSANCYGSLWELNYYNHPRTTYDVVLPNETNKDVPPDQKPFDDIVLVSCSGKDPNNQFVGEDGKLDLDGLNLMVALNLFAESVGGTRSLKEAMEINGQALDGYGHLKQVRQGEITVMMRNLASFGLTAVWYPKYRIASATASLVGQTICENWLESHISEASIIEDAKSEWKRIRDGNIDTLTSPENLLSVKNRIDEHLVKVKQARLKTDVSSSQLSKYLENFPEDDSFKKKFAEGGQYIELIRMQVDHCQNAYRDAIETTFDDQLGNIDTEGKRGIKDVEMFFEKLDAEVKKDIDECPLQMPTLSFEKLDFGQLDRAIKSFWLRSLWLQDESVKFNQHQIIDQYCDLINGPENSFYTEIRNHFLRPILENIRAELGFGVPPKDTNAPNRRKTISERIREIEKNLNQGIDQLTTQHEAAINPKKSICVKIVTNNDQNSIGEDARILSHQIIAQDGGKALIDGTTMTALLQKGHQEIVNLMTTTYRGVSLSEMRSHDVVKEVEKYVAESDPEITNLAQRSNPYQTFAPKNYVPLLANPPKIIFGRDSVDNILSQLRGDLDFSNSGDCSVDHLLLFYQEEYGFTIDDLSVFQILENTYFNENPLGKYGHSTHKDPHFYDLELQEKVAKLQQWCRPLNRFVPEICQHINEDAFSGVFRQTTNGYVYEYRVDGIPKRLSLQENQEGIKTLSQKQHTDNYHNFFSQVRTCFAELERSDVEKLSDSMLVEIDDNELHERLGNIYRQFINDVYSDDDIDDELDDDLDAHFYEQTPQMQEEDTTEEPLVSNQNGDNETIPDDTDESNPEPTDESGLYDEVIPEEGE